LVGERHLLFGGRLSSLRRLGMRLPGFGSRLVEGGFQHSDLGQGLLVLCGERLGPFRGRPGDPLCFQCSGIGLGGGSQGFFRCGSGLAYVKDGGPEYAVGVRRCKAWPTVRGSGARIPQEATICTGVVPYWYGYDTSFAA
jgi:hypothetical protein